MAIMKVPIEGLLSNLEL